MLVSRLVQLWFMMPFRHADRSYTEIKPMAWVGLGLFELVGPVAVCFLENMGHSITVAVCIIDSIVFIGQFVMYQINHINANDAHLDAESDDAKAKARKSALKKLSKRTGAKVDEGEGRVKLSRFFKIHRHFDVEDSIYNLAFITLLDPKVVEEWNAEHPDQNYIKDL